MDDILKDTFKRIEYKIDKLIDCMDRLCEIVESALEKQRENKYIRNDSNCICDLNKKRFFYTTDSWVCPIHGIQY